MLHELHVLRQAPHGRAALAVERDGEELAVAAGRDEGAEGLALEEADAGEAALREARRAVVELAGGCLLYTSPSPRDGLLSRMPSSA